MEKSDFGNGSIPQHILRLSLPIMAAEFVHVLYNLVDRMYIGHMENVGTEAITGLGIAFPLITLINAFANLFSTGGAPLSSLARGQGDLKRAACIQETAFTLLVLIGAVLTVALSLFAKPLLELLGGDKDTLPYALQYFQIYVLGTIPVMISLGMNSFINAQGFSKIGMLTVILGAAVNIVLDPIFIYTLHMGIRGAAIATVIAQSVSALWALGFLCSSRPILKLHGLHIDSRQAAPIFRLGMTGFCFRVTNSVIQSVVNITLIAWGGELSTLYVGAMSIINSVREISELPANSITHGTQPVLGYNYGAGLSRRVRDALRFSLMIVLGINFIVWGFLELAPSVLISIFTDDSELAVTAIRCLRIYFCVFPFISLQSLGQSTFVALNKPRQALFFSLLRKVFLILPLTLILPHWKLGIMGPFWAEAISQVVGGSACFLTMYLTVWHK